MGDLVRQRVIRVEPPADQPSTLRLKSALLGLGG